MNRVRIAVALGCVFLASSFTAPLIGLAKADNLGPHSFYLHDSTYNATANGTYEQLSGFNQVGCALDYVVKSGPTSGFQLLNISMVIVLGVGCAPSLVIQDVVTAPSAFTGSQGTFTVTDSDGFATQISNALEYSWAGGVDNQPTVYDHFTTAPTGCTVTNSAPFWNCQTAYGQSTCCYHEGLSPTCSGGSCPIQSYSEWDVAYDNANSGASCGTPCVNHQRATPYAIYNVGFPECDNHGNYFFGTQQTCAGYQTYTHQPHPPGY